VPTVLAALVLAAAVVLAAAGGGGEPAARKPLRAQAEPAREEPGRFDLRRRPQVVQIEGVDPKGRPERPGLRDDAPSPGVGSDAEVRAELRKARRELASFKRHLATAAFLHTGPRARVLPNGSAVAPEDAPGLVQRVILAANEIARLPYKWGGGHGAWRDSGYDCSGSVSFALAAAGLLDRPMTSGGFMDWGDRGPGEWITIYANPGHMFMVVAGLRFDTSGRGRAGTRWQEGARSASGYAVRHPPGL
jgi:hypothetical protein